MKNVFTLAECLAIVIVVGLGLCMLPALAHHAGRTSIPMKNASNIRTIILGAAIYAQANGGGYPGKDSDHKILPADHPMLTSLKNPSIVCGPNGLNGSHPATRLALLISGNYFTSDICVSPGENAQISKWPHANQTAASPFTGGTTGHYSYALLQLTDEAEMTGQQLASAAQHTGRLSEWRETTNSQAVVVSDRNTATTAGHYRSIWTKPSFWTGKSERRTTDGWSGAVGFNDQHVETVKDACINITTKYGAITNPGSTTTGDNLFLTTGDSSTDPSANAMMITGFKG